MQSLLRRFNKKQKRFVLLSLILVFILGYLEFQGIIWHNKIFARQYQVEGLDVSNHQKYIDWGKVTSSGKYRFVYIKATEGHDYTDAFFKENWQNAKKGGLLVGAYHFFSKRSTGKEQADYFISVVPKENDSLPPVVDIEIDTNLDKNKIRQELADFTRQVEKHYQKHPILYVTYNTYETYIDGYFLENPLWVRDIVKYPSINRDWLVWQYNNRGKVDGINTHVDINVFKGTKEELKYMTNISQQIP